MDFPQRSLGTGTDTGSPPPSGVAVYGLKGFPEYHGSKLAGEFDAPRPTAAQRSSWRQDAFQFHTTAMLHHQDPAQQQLRASSGCSPGGTSQAGPETKTTAWTACFSRSIRPTSAASRGTARISVTPGSLEHQHARPMRQVYSIPDSVSGQTGQRAVRNPIARLSLGYPVGCPPNVNEVAGGDGPL